MGGYFIFTLSIKIEKEYYDKYHPKFRGYYLLINSEQRCEHANFMGNIYTNGFQILSVEVPFEVIKEIIGNNNNFKVICVVDKTYFK